jgi:hypothetical protein
MNTVVNILVPSKAGNFLTSRVTISFWSTLLNGASQIGIQHSSSQSLSSLHGSEFVRISHFFLQ